LQRENSATVAIFNEDNDSNPFWSMAGSSVRPLPPQQEHLIKGLAAIEMVNTRLTLIGQEIRI
jgi:hypothetical protein